MLESTRELKEQIASVFDGDADRTATATAATAAVVDGATARRRQRKVELGIEDAERVAVEVVGEVPHHDAVSTPRQDRRLVRHKVWNGHHHLVLTGFDVPEGQSAVLTETLPHQINRIGFFRRDCGGELDADFLARAKHFIRLRRNDHTGHRDFGIGSPRPASTRLIVVVVSFEPVITATGVMIEDKGFAVGTIAVDVEACEVLAAIAITDQAETEVATEVGRGVFNAINTIRIPDLVGDRVEKQKDAGRLNGDRGHHFGGTGLRGAGVEVEASESAERDDEEQEQFLHVLDQFVGKNPFCVHFQHGSPCTKLA